MERRQAESYFLKYHVMEHYIAATGAADINQAADTTNWTAEMPFAGRLNLEKTFLRWTEATGSQTSAQGVVSIEVAGTEVATLTANQSDAIGETQTFTLDSAVDAGSPYVYFDAADDIEVVTKTQATGGTVAGDGTVYLAVSFSK